MKWLGLVLLGLTCLLGVVRFNTLSLWSVGIGIAFCLALFILTVSRPETPALVQHNEWQDRFHELEARSAKTNEGLNLEIQKVQQKLIRSEERCHSYQKLVDVHQAEIDKLKLEKDNWAQQVIEKERKISELQLARLEPDLFDAEKRQLESSYRELKKQFEENKLKLRQATKEKTSSGDLFGST